MKLHSNHRNQNSVGEKKELSKDKVIAGLPAGFEHHVLGLHDIQNPTLFFFKLLPCHVAALHFLKVFLRSARTEKSYRINIII